MRRDPRRRLIIALDYDNLSAAYKMARNLAGFAGMFKVGARLFTAEGPAAVKKLSRLGPGIFLDLKFHDIPSSVAGAVAAAARLPRVRLINVHALGGTEMMRSAAAALKAKRKGAEGPKLIAVTVLTSHDAASLRRVGVLGSPEQRAVKLARLALRVGLDGVVTSAHAVAQVRRACGKGFLIIVPSIRPLGSAPKLDDQARMATPGEAIRAGADYLVVGRPITAAKDPRAAAEAILHEIGLAQSHRI